MLGNNSSFRMKRNSILSAGNSLSVSNRFSIEFEKMTIEELKSVESLSECSSNSDESPPSKERATRKPDQNMYRFSFMQMVPSTGLKLLSGSRTSSESIAAALISSAACQPIAEVEENEANQP